MSELSKPINAYVAFLDVLGFKEMVRKEKLREKLENFFKITKENFKIIEAAKKEIRKFILSDSIILVVEIDNDSFGNFEKLLRAIKNLQADLALEDIWLRGAVSYGDVHLSDSGDEEKIIYGDGYIRAFELENKAIYPRVIIDPRIVSLLKKTRTSFLDDYSCLIRDPNDAERYPIKNTEIESLDNDLVFAMPSDRNSPDDDLFISYGSKILYESLKSLSADHITRMYRILKKAMYEEHEHFPKYNWVKKYFTEILRSGEHYLNIQGTKYIQIRAQIDEFYKL
jgi:hypothetical protein